MILEFKVEEKGVYVDVKINGMNVENTTKLLDAVKNITNDEITDAESRMMKKFEEGYNCLEGNYEEERQPKSEIKAVNIKTEEEDDQNTDYGVRIVDGEKRYQMFYICTSCNHKGKRYLRKGVVYTNCHECGHRMNVRPATENGIGFKDTFSNYYIAGAFQRNSRNKDSIPS